MVMININDKKLARIAETLSSTQKDVEFANKRALRRTYDRAGPNARRRLRKQANLVERSAKSRTASKIIGAEHYRIFISDREALINSLKGVRPAKNKPVRYKGKTYPRSFWQFGKKDKSRLWPLSRRTSARRSDLEIHTIDISQEVAGIGKQVQDDNVVVYRTEFERSLVDRRRATARRANA